MRALYAALFIIGEFGIHLYDVFSLIRARILYGNGDLVTAVRFYCDVFYRRAVRFPIESRIRKSEAEREHDVFVVPTVIAFFRFLVSPRFVIAVADVYVLFVVGVEQRFILLCVYIVVHIAVCDAATAEIVKSRI